MADCICLNPNCPKPENPDHLVTCQACGSPLMVRNRYRAVRKLGQGGFGSTFIARDMDLPSKPYRVIKQLRLNHSNPEIAKLSLELFNREAEVLEKLGQHSQIPSLYAHFEENGNYYLVQEFILGLTLSQEVHRNGPMNELQARQVMQEVLLILSYVHSQNTVHRDIKPANLIRRKDDQRLVLIDFGAVKNLETGKNKPALENTAIRSMGFSPPEQIQGQEVNPSSDLYALAATCLNLMTLESPTKFFNPHTGQWDWSEVLNLSPEFDQILRTMLDQRMDQRFPSATDALRALQGLKADNSHVSRVSIAKSTSSQPIISTSVSSSWAARRPETPGLYSPSTGFTPSQPPSVVPGSPTGLTGRTGSMAIQPPSPPRIPSMAGQDLRDQSFSNQNLARRDFRKANLRGADFSGANLQGADLRGVEFNTPPPKVVRLLSTLAGGAITVGGVAVGLAGILASLLVPGVLVWYFLNSTWLALAAGAIGGAIAWSFLWSLSGQQRQSGKEPKRYTRLYRADLRGAQMDEKFRLYAKQQKALLD
ncbi:MAG: protein kinase [Thermostichales cyanobacterium GMQP_bins_62]